MARRSSTTLPWTLVVASLLLAGVVLYLLFAGYLPAQQRVAGLEQELRQVYARETQLQTRLQREQQQGGTREQQLAAFAAERQALTKRVEELEAELAALRGRRRR